MDLQIQISALMTFLQYLFIRSCCVLAALDAECENRLNFSTSFLKSLFLSHNSIVIL